MYKVANIFNLEIFAETKQSLLNFLDQELKNNKLIKIFTPNPEQVVLASQDKEFEIVLKKADILIPDGAGLVLASRILSRKLKINAIKERITGVDLVQDLLNLAEKNDWQVLVLGGKNYQDLREKNTKIYYLESYQDIKKPLNTEEALVKNKISELKPEIVLVAFGAPYQENWIIDHQQLLEENKVKIVMTVGGSFDFLLGKVKRAPTWIRKIGLEWLFRLIQEPWRWRRQLRLLGFLKLIFRILALGGGN